MKYINFIIILTISLTLIGCGGRQAIRMVDSQVYQDLEWIKYESTDMRNNANRSYSDLQAYTKKILEKDLKDGKISEYQYYQENIKLDNELKDFNQITDTSYRINSYSNNVLRELGWENGHRNNIQSFVIITVLILTGAIIG